jgi:exo-1,4-beta-D-glucosaminidase
MLELRKDPSSMQIRPRTILLQVWKTSCRVPSPAGLSPGVAHVFRRNVLRSRFRLCLSLLGSVVILNLGCLSRNVLLAQSTSLLELSSNWQLASAKQAIDPGALISSQQYSTASWYPIHRMPATVLEILEEDGVYPDLYYGMNLATEVPQDLYKQDWWYRTTFTAPADRSVYWLSFPSINYRSEIWLNGKELANSSQVAGMYDAHELNVTDAIRPGVTNNLAIKVTPEQKIQDVNGIELADSWFDWINWKYLGYKGPLKKDEHGISFVPDRNAGVWKPVFLHSTNALKLSNALVNTTLPLPRTDSATLTVYANLTNGSAQSAQGRVVADITRHGKPGIHLEQPVSINPGHTREISFDEQHFPQLRVSHPDLWWPYTMGKPSLYDLHLQILIDNKPSDAESIRFGIRTITQHRDQDNEFPKVGKGGSFYLQVNGKNFLIRGAVYTPDLLFRYDPNREAAQLHYVKDIGLNMLRWESKISSEHIVELADEEGIPLMFGWMCCNQWEKWDQWDAADRRIAEQSLQSQISMLRSHAAVFLWANGSDGRAPDAVRATYHHVLQDLHWQNATVDTVSSYNKGPDGDPIWDGIHMEGPYS